MWTIAWPPYIRIPDATSATASSGTATMMSSTSSTSAVGSLKARLPSTRPRKRSRRPASRLATAWTGQPARVSATPRAVPTAPAPTIPMTGGSPRLAPDMGMRMVVLVDICAVAMVARWQRVQVDPGVLDGLDGLGRAAGSSAE